VVFPL